jgi:TP901 family phage tail tape measure protein
MAFDINLNTRIARAQVIGLNRSIVNLARAADKSSVKMQAALGGGFGGTAQLKGIETAVYSVKNSLISMAASQRMTANAAVSGQTRTRIAVEETLLSTAKAATETIKGKNLISNAYIKEGAIIEASNNAKKLSEARVQTEQAKTAAETIKGKNLTTGAYIREGSIIEASNNAKRLSEARVGTQEAKTATETIKGKNLTTGAYIKEGAIIEASNNAKRLSEARVQTQQAKTATETVRAKRIETAAAAANAAAAQAAAARIIAAQRRTDAALLSSQTRSMAATTVAGFNSANQGAAALRSTLGALGASFGIFSASTLLVATSTFMLVRAFKSTVTVGAELENSMQRVYAVTGSLGQIAGEVTPAMQMLSSAVRDVAKGTIFTSTEVAQGAIRFAQAGFSAANTASALNATAALATIGMTDMGQAANTVTSILNSFGLEATALQGVVDTMAVAVTGSMLNITQLSSALSYIGPLAKETNTSFTETVIILELMADAGVKASKAGTSLRRGMVNLLNPTSRQMGVLRELNVSTNKASGEMRSMLDIAKDLATEGITPAQLSLLFGARAVAAWTQVINEANGKMITFIDAQKDIAGTSLVLRRQLEQNLTDQFKLLVSAVQEVQQVLFEQFGPRLTELVVGFKDWVTEIGNSREELVAMATAAYDTARTLAAGGAIVAAAAFAFSKYKLAVGTAAVTAAVGGLNKALLVTKILLLGIVKNPIIATLLTASAVFAYFRRSVEDSSGATQEQIEATKELVQSQKDLADASEKAGLAVTRIGYLEAAEGLRLATQATVAKKRAVNDLAEAQVVAANKESKAIADLTARAMRGGMPLGMVQPRVFTPADDFVVTQQTVRQQAIAETNLALEKQLELTFGGREATLAGRMQNLQSGRQRNLPNAANAQRFQQMAQDSVPDGGMPQQRAARIAAEVNALTKDAASNLILFDREIKKVTESTYNLRVERMKVSGVYLDSPEQRKAHTKAIVAEELALKTLLATFKVKPPVDVIKGTAEAFKSATADIEATTQAAILTQQHLQKMGQSTPTETLLAGIATTRDGLREMNAEFESQREILLAAQAAKQKILDTVTVDQGKAESTTGAKLLTDANDEINKIKAAIIELEQKSTEQTNSYNRDLLSQIRSVDQLADAKAKAAAADAAASVDESAKREAERKKGVASAGGSLLNDLSSPSARLQAEEVEKLKILEQFRVLEMQAVSGQHKQEMAIEAEFSSLKLQIRQQTLDALAAIESEAINKSISAYEDEAKAKESIELRKTRAALNGFSSLTSEGAKSSRKMFELNKAINVASIIADTPAAISGAAKWGYSLGGTPGGIAAGLAAAANQAALLRQASSASFGASSSVSAPATATAATPETPEIVVPLASDSLVNQSTSARSQASALQQRPQGDVNITLSASSVDTEGMSELLLRQAPVIASIVRESQAEQGIS